MLILQWQWPLWKTIPLVAVFVAFDIAFIGGNLFKIADGGWFPLLIAAAIAIAMTTWRKGRGELARMLEGDRLPMEIFISDISKRNLPRAPGTAVFMTLSSDGAPPTLLHHVKHNHILHEQVVLLSIRSTDTPSVPPAERIKLDSLGQGFYRLIATYGYMQTPHVPQIMKDLSLHGLVVEPMKTTFFLGRETLLTGGRSKMMRWRKAVFAFMSRNAGNPTAYFGIPPNRVVELGAQIEL